MVIDQVILPEGNIFNTWNKSDKPEFVGRKVVNQQQLSSECWAVQFYGLEYCTSCPYQNKKRLCGGRKIRETGKNSIVVPIGL